MEKKFYTCEEVASRYGVKVSTVWEWIRTGRLEAYKLMRMYRVTEEQLEAFEKQAE